MVKANEKYSFKVREGKSTHQAMYTLGWTVNELDRLVKEGRQLRAEICSSICAMQEAGENIVRRLTKLRPRLTEFMKQSTRQRQVAASHVLVIMISPEDRSKKPYGLPVECIPYAGMSHQTLRRLLNSLVKEMIDRNMSVVGKQVMHIVSNNVLGWGGGGGRGSISLSCIKHCV